jgi:hypothetical protein
VNRNLSFFRGHEIHILAVFRCEFNFGSLLNDLVRIKLDFFSHQPLLLFRVYSITENRPKNSADNEASRSSNSSAGKSASSPPTQTVIFTNALLLPP